MHQIRLPLIPLYTAYSAPPEGLDTLAVFKGPTSKGKGEAVGEGKIKERDLAHPKVLAWCPYDEYVMKG